MESLVKDFSSVYREKRILLTGNTGFKGTWMTSWLRHLGAKVYGFSNEVPTDPSMYKLLKMEEGITQYWGDISDHDSLNNVISSVRPDFIFHFAAQALVGTSYEEPLQTISTNVMGGVNLLDLIKDYDENITVIFITSDKAYENVEQIWGYRECDRMGGKDIYSSSKGAIDILAKSFFTSFIKDNPNVKFGLARAGNVIGGGDWARDRIVVDAINAWSEGLNVKIRCPKATRPWQHVLEPLSGYLRLGQVLHEEKINIDDFCDFNFGPSVAVNQSVLELITDLSSVVLDSKINPFEITDDIPFNESQLLKLNCEKALLELCWESTLNYNETVEFTGLWYRTFLSGDLEKLVELTERQLVTYTEIAKKKGASWI